MLETHSRPVLVTGSPAAQMPGSPSSGGGKPSPMEFKAALELHHYNLKQGQMERNKRLQVGIMQVIIHVYCSLVSLPLQLGKSFSQILESLP